MGRHKKKKKQNQKKNTKNPKNKYAASNHHNNTNGKTQSKKNEILNKLQHAQDITSSQLNEAHSSNKYSNNKKWDKKNKNKNKNKKKRYNYNSELNEFIDQLRPLGLGIRNTSSDGNCLFRAISDQLNGNQNHHNQCRKDIIQYMMTNSTEFAPFYVGDYAAYLKKMGRNGVWGGNMELIAAAKTFKVDIVIHSLNAARYEILYQKGKPIRSIHISYHSEKHYASVRRIDDMKSNKAAQDIILDKSHSELLQREQQRAEIAWCHNGGNPLDINNAKDELMDLTPKERVVVVKTGCYDIHKVKSALKFLDGDIEAAVENIMMDMSLMADKHKDNIIQELKVNIDNNNKGDKKQKKKKKEYHYNLEENEEKVNSEKNNIKCVECSFEHEVLLIYLRHYKCVHYNEEKEVLKSTICVCGHNNECDVGFCSECKWDLRFKPMIPIAIDKTKKGDKMEYKTNKSDGKMDEKYKKYLNEYWICKRCTFWNYKISKECMVCSMLKETPKCNKMKQKKKKKQKKKNEFGWICGSCTMENKPTQQTCKICDNKKPKKGRKNEKREDGKEDIKTNEKWSVAGNHKCHCGSNKKYKKCCKKLEKHRKLIKNEENNCNLTEGINVINANELNGVIDKLEYEISRSNFKGKTKNHMMRELSKLKAQKNALHKTLESNKNKMSKAKNRVNNKDNDGSNNNAVNNAVVNKTIAI